MGPKAGNAEDRSGSSEQSDLGAVLIGAKTADFPAPAKRPLLSALDCGKFEMTFGFLLEPWREALRSALTEAE